MPNVRNLSCAALLGAAAMSGLAGCAATGQPVDDEATPSPVLRELARALPGRYATARDGSGADDQAALELLVRAAPSSASDELRLLLQQHRTDQDAAPRRFELTLRSDDGPDGLSGEFAPLNAAGVADRRCSMDFRLRDDGIVGETDPRQCRFGEVENETGLLKEIAFDGNQLVIGDRLIDLNDGKATAADQIHAFFRVRTFSGWAGVQEGDSWRVARDLELDTTTAALEVVDASGMALGVTIRLAFYRMERGDRPVLLRLSVSDGEGNLIGESWSDPGAGTIGLAIPGLQVGLEE